MTDLRELFEEIYDLTKNPLATPYSILENIRLDNYEYINYYKKDGVLIAEMKCFLEDEEFIFYYHFDEKDYLQRIFKKENGHVSEFFNRGISLKYHREKYIRLKTEAKTTA